MKKGLTFVELLDIVEDDNKRPEIVYHDDVAYRWNKHYGDYTSDDGEYLTNNINFTLIGYKKCIAVYYDVDVLTYSEKAFFRNTLVPMGVKNAYKTKEDKDGVHHIICKIENNPELVALPYMFGKDFFKGMEEDTWYSVKSLLE